MSRRVGLQAIVIFPVLLLTLIVVMPVHGEPSKRPLRADSPHDLINLVNALRASNGLPAYSLNSILMYTAGSHAGFMAATGIVLHTGAGGSGVTDRLLAAGYPLAGDLSLGGFRSENITAGLEGMTAQAAVDQWTGDALHLNTMLSPNLTEIGAGVAVAHGRVYYVIDCAHPTTAAAARGATQSSGGGTTLPAEAMPIPDLVVSTPNEAGSVVHTVLAGQTLWQIAIAYNVKINDIKALNNLPDDNIFPGDTLLVKMDFIPMTETPSLVPMRPITTSSFVSTNTVIPAAVLPISTIPAPAHSSLDSSTTMSFVIGLVALAIFAGGVFAWRGKPPADSG